MRKCCYILFFFILFFGKTDLFAQTHVSVPLGHSVYRLLDQAEARGLCSPLPVVKPYTRAKVVEVINEILFAEPSRRFGALSEAEREILENVRMEFTRGETGFNLAKGLYGIETEGKKGLRFSLDIGATVESSNSIAYYTDESDTSFGTDSWATLYVNGDVGENFSFNVDFLAGFMRAQRNFLGTYNTYSSELEETSRVNGHENSEIRIYSQPLAFFPYTYQKRWDGFMFNFGEISASNMESWPENFSIAAGMLGEISGTVFKDMLLLRAGRFQREWGAMSPGSSLVFNAAARPFIGVEAVFNPVSWFSYSSISGFLEYYNVTSIYDDPRSFQNAFSLQQIEFNYGNFLHVDFGSGMIWPKRLEFGYIFPLIDNFFYQNFIGKFDNASIHGSIKLRYPGLGGIWLSGFIDEIEVSSAGQLFDLDRHMFAYQAGLQLIIPNVPFTSLTMSYTKVEPYNYTHHKDIVPWYGNTAMQKAYVNNGVSLGHYIPPNSDEIKIRFGMSPLLGTSSHAQYQLIRHGADFGPQQVAGSSLLSELDPSGRSSKNSLRKNFLKDGAYQWMHIIKIGAEHKLSSLPITVFGETGLVYSYFTQIDPDDYAKYNPDMSGNSNYQSYHTRRNPSTGDYLSSTAYILTLGFKVFR